MTLSAAEITALMAAFVTVGGIVVKLTPTKKDDEWWRALMRTIGRE